MNNFCVHQGTVIMEEFILGIPLSGRAIYLSTLPGMFT